MKNLKKLSKRYLEDIISVKLLTEGRLTDIEPNDVIACGCINLRNILLSDKYSVTQDSLLIYANSLTNKGIKNLLNTKVDIPFLLPFKQVL